MKPFLDPAATADGDAQDQYVEGQARATFPQLLASFEAESRAAVDSENCELDLRYGPAERQTFDFFAARGAPRGTLVYFHAGYWQSRDKSTFRFIAPAFTAVGLNVALVNYPLCPSVSVAELIDATRPSMAAVRARAAATDGADGADSADSADAARLVLSGHSAGGHIAIELALSEIGASSGAVAGVVALSGIFDLSPLMATSLNDRLRLDAAGALACSPIHRVRHGAAPALFAVGGAETPAFLAQSRRMHAAWTSADNRSVLHIEPGADHFSLLRSFSLPDGMLFKQACDLLRGPREAI